LGLTSPRMLAEPVVMFVAESTLTEGKSLAESLKVSKLLMSPLTVPKEFLRKSAQRSTGLLFFSSFVLNICGKI